MKKELGYPPNDQGNQTVWIVYLICISVLEKTEPLNNNQDVKAPQSSFSSVLKCSEMEIQLFKHLINVFLSSYEESED